MHRQMHPQIRSAWEQEGHPLASHPFFAKHGRALSGPAFETSKGNVARTWKAPEQQEGDYRWGNSLQETMGLFEEMLEEITALEAPHIRELEQAAVEIASEVWGIDPSRLRAKISQQVQPNERPPQERPEEPEEEDSPSFEEMEEQDFSPEFDVEDDSQRHIDHRVLMNLLTQGAAVHQYNSLHHMAAEKVNAIDPNLLKTYTKLSTGITHTYWILPILQMMRDIGAAKGTAVGSEQLEMGQDGKGIVVAKGMCFPVLLHELTKGIMELITYHQISNKDPVTQEKIVQGADRFDYEPWMIMIGPEVWRRFLKVLADNKIPSNRIAYIIQQLSAAEPEEASEFIDAVIENPERASQMLGRFNPQEEPEEPVYGDDPENFDTGEESDPDAWKRGVQESAQPQHVLELAEEIEEAGFAYENHKDERDFSRIAQLLRAGKIESAKRLGSSLDTDQRTRLDMAGLWDIETLGEATMAPAAPTAPPKPKTTPRPSRPPAPGHPDPFDPKMPGKGKPGVMPQPKFRDKDFGDDDMIDGISDTIGREWEVGGDAGLAAGGELDLPELGAGWDPLQDDHPLGIDEGGAVADACAQCGEPVNETTSIELTDGSIVCPACAVR